MTASSSSSAAGDTCSSSGGGTALSSLLARPPAVLDYAAIHGCLLGGDARASLPVLALLLAVHFRVLAAAAGTGFTPAVTRLAARLRLSPSMAAVTLLALGNGAPDAFASAAALSSSSSTPRAGLAAVLSAGAFVSAFVVGAVALVAAPSFAVPPAPFARDAFCYLVAASALFGVYLSAEIFLWQAVGLVLFYAFFVGLVFYMDSGAPGKPAIATSELEMDLPRTISTEEDHIHNQHHRPTLCAVLSKVTKVCEWPVRLALKLTIPSTVPCEWKNKSYYISANICLCPLLLLHSLGSFIPPGTQIVFLLPHRRFPLWSVVLLVSFCLAVTHFLLSDNDDDDGRPTRADETTTTSVVISFTMSVVWISTAAAELVNCLATVGTVTDVPPSVLGMTVLAWGNSVGDLVSDVALARAGRPATAVAGCFAGPMFNLLVGLGSALVARAAASYPDAYPLEVHAGTVAAFAFLLFSLMCTLVVVAWARFRVTRVWGCCLMGMYVVFTGLSVAVALALPSG